MKANNLLTFTNNKVAALKNRWQAQAQPLKTFVLKRAPSTDHGTVGYLSLNGQHVCYMMELPDRNNKSNLSRIPVGRYKVVYLGRSASGKYKDVYHVMSVDGRIGILIHAGNFAGDKLKGFKTDSWGCLLPASRLGLLNKQLAGLASRGALRRLHEHTQRQDFYLEVA